MPLALETLLLRLWLRLRLRCPSCRGAECPEPGLRCAFQHGGCRATHHQAGSFCKLRGA